MRFKEELLADLEGPASNFRHIQLCIASICRVPEMVGRVTFFLVRLSYTQLRTRWLLRCPPELGDFGPKQGGEGVKRAVTFGREPPRNGRAEVLLISNRSRDGCEVF